MSDLTYDINGNSGGGYPGGIYRCCKKHILFPRKSGRGAGSSASGNWRKLKVHPRDLSENQQMLERLESIVPGKCIRSKKDQVQQMIRTFEGFLDGQNPRQIQGYRRYLEKAVSVLEYYDR